MLPFRHAFVCGLLLVAGVSFGQFGPGQTVMANILDPEVRAADVDMDGDLDVIGIFGGDHLKWLPNTDGQGTFGAYNLLLDLDGDCGLFEVADVDGDGDPDVLLVDEEDTLHVLRNLGDGTFLQDIPIVLPVPAEALAIADVTGDGFTDLVLSLDFPEGAGIGILSGTAEGLGGLTNHPAIHSGAASECLRIGDVDLLGGLDLVLTAANDSLVVARNVAGDGTEWVVEHLSILTGDLSYPYHRPQLMDIDADGDLDLGEARGSAVHWLRNVLDEGGVLAFEEQVIAPWTTSGNGVFGRSTCGTGASMVYVPNNPVLPVQWNTYVHLLNGFPESHAIMDVPRGSGLLLADLDGDDREDLLLQEGNALRWYANELDTTGAELELPLLDTLCLSGAPVALPTVEPAGGQWYGHQVFNGMLYRANLLMTTDLQVVHAVFPEGNCPLAATTNVRVIQGPEITTTVPPVICSADAPIVMNAVPTDVTWYGLDGASVIDPATWGGGYVVCEYTDGTGQMCSDLEGPIMRWNTLPAELEELPLLCPTDPTATIEVIAAPPLNVYWEGPVLAPTATSALFDPGIGPGTYTVVLNVEASGPNQCRNSDTIQVVVGELPEIMFQPMAVYCAEGGSISLSGASPSGGTWSGTGVDLGLLDPTVVGAGMHLLNYFAVSADGCAAQASTTITLASATEVDHAATDLLFCEGDDPIQFTAWPAGGSWSNPVDATGSLDPEQLDPGAYPVTYTYTDPQGCSLTNDTLVVTKGVPQEVSIDPVPRLCLSTPAFELSGSASGTWSGAVTGEGAQVLIDPAALGVGTWPVTLSVAPLDECPGEATIELVIDVCTGMAGIAATGLVAMPQPFSDRTTVRFGDLHVQRLDVFDATGKRVYGWELRNDRISQVEVDLQGLPDGMYLLMASTTDGMARLPLVKAH
ncbi:MAG: T9SS type A sorting domain-containing protein [Flavobacteriales bacterium]|jgi:hypothetical protein|nr:T9SS type A sorting domain-containing protein [Flavobacteriales bacterium]